MKKFIVEFKRVKSLSFSAESEAELLAELGVLNPDVLESWFDDVGITRRWRIVACDDVTPEEKADPEKSHYRADCCLQDGRFVHCDDAR